MEGLASRRHGQPGWSISSHQYAGGDAARLAAFRRQAYAHVGLLGTGTLAELDLRWRIPRHLWIRTTHPLAFRGQGWSDGTSAAHSRARRGACDDRRVPPAPTGGGGWLRRWRGEARPH